MFLTIIDVVSVVDAVVVVIIHIYDYVYLFICHDLIEESY